MKVGILAFQGCIEPHARMLKGLGVEPVYVRCSKTLQTAERLILPGGESTTMIKLIHQAALWDELKQYVKSNPCWGICAGAILLAQEVSNPTQASLAALAIHAKRNAYGSQLESFHTQIATTLGSQQLNLDVDFIRAPLLSILSGSAKALAREKNQHPALIQQNKVLASSFHTELGQDTRLHEYFLNL